MRKIFAVIFLLLLLISTNNQNAFAASDFQQQDLIKRYFAYPQTDWDKLTASNKNIVDENLLEKVKNQYFRALVRSAEEARNNGGKRVIVSDAFPYANLADYIGKKINNPPGLRYKLAQEYVEDGKLDVAIDICNNIIMTEPKNIEVLGLKADLFLRLEMPKEAMETYEYIVKIDGKNETALYRLGVLNYQLSRFPDAIKVFKKVLAINPKNEPARRFIDIYEGKVKSSNDKKFNESSIQHFMLAEKYYSVGKYQNASDEYTLAIEDDPYFYKAYAYLGESLTRQQKYLEASQILEQAIKISPKEPEAYHYLGLALEKQYNFSHDASLLQKAVENYEKALQVSPQYDKVKTDLDRAKKELGGKQN